MNAATRGTLALAALVLLAGCAGPRPEPRGLEPPRLDEAQEDLPGIAVHRDAWALRARVETLMADARGIGRYHVAKARAWLEFAASAALDGHGAEMAQAALRESYRILGALGRGDEQSLRTPLLPGAGRLRRDLWDEAGRIKESGHLACAGEPTAAAEVDLVWAGYLELTGGMRAAHDTVDRAERRLRAAGALLVQCENASVMPLRLRIDSDLDAERLR